MLTIEECRRLIGPEVEMDDAELRNLRDGLYHLAQGVIELWCRREESSEPEEDQTNGNR